MPQNKLSNSRFQMWRCLIALVHADHVVTQEERDFFLKRFDKINFSDEQKNILKHELENPVNIDSIFEGITDKEDRATLIYFARLLFWSDGEFVAQEDKILKHLHSKVIDKIDLQKTMNDVNEATNDIMAKYDNETKEEHKKSGIVSALSFALESGLWPLRVIRDILD